MFGSLEWSFSKSSDMLWCLREKSWSKEKVMYHGSGDSYQPSAWVCLPVNAGFLFSCLPLKGCHKKSLWNFKSCLGWLSSFFNSYHSTWICCMRSRNWIRVDVEWRKVDGLTLTFQINPRKNETPVGKFQKYPLILWFIKSLKNKNSKTNYLNFQKSRKSVKKHTQLTSFNTTNN